MDREKRRRELNCIVHPLDTLGEYKYVVVCSLYQGHWILSRHKMRDTWETQGGHIETNETPMDTARRELYEESGITDADIYPVCDYYGYDDYGHANGVVFLAVVHKLGRLPESEMQATELFSELPANLTYPQTTPVLIAEAAKKWEEVQGEKK
ncbi:MAG: NUDIX domain-containing protein [Clostridiales bacterium]|nr:NUDIX domain-containing protein [Clostridiales bacterium]